MPTPLPHQIVGAQFLASRERALLADDCRVGKTGTFVMACDLVMARRVLVVTTTSNRANFGRDFADWQALPRKVQVLYKAETAIDPSADVLVVGWSVVSEPVVLKAISALPWDVVGLDEAHYAANIGTFDDPVKRTVAVYGKGGLCHLGTYCWPLTATPIPDGRPEQIWPMLRGLAPRMLGEFSSYDAFRERYCEMDYRMMRGKRVKVVIGGKNLAELSGRLDGFWLRRTQADVGIREPFYSMLALEPTGHPWLQMTDENAAILHALVTGDTSEVDDMELGRVRRLTGSLKAPLVAAYVEEEMGGGRLDKVVLMCWHTEVIDLLCRRLSAFGVARIDGATPPLRRPAEVDKFQRGKARIFVGQILAAGEALDLSASCNLIFVEGSFVPKDMRQAALRITNHQQKRQCLVRFAALAGSIDEAVMTVLSRKVATIKEVLPA